MPNAASRRAYRAGGRPGRMSQEREFVEQGRVGGGGRGLGQGRELGFELFAFPVEVGDPGADPGAHRGGRGVGRVGGQLFEFEDLGVLRGLDPPDPGLQLRGLGIARRVGVGVGVGAPVACWAVGMGLYFRGEPGEADRWFAESAALAPASAQWPAGASSLAYRSLIAGELGRARIPADAGRGCSGSASGSTAPRRPAAWCRWRSGYRSPRAAGREAEPLIEGGVGFLRSGGQPAEVAMALLHQGSVLRAVGERERSRAAITEARAVIGSCPDPGILTGRLKAAGRPRGRASDQQMRS